MNQLEQARLNQLEQTRLNQLEQTRLALSNLPGNRMKHPFTDEELLMIFEIAHRSIYQDFAAIADDLDLADKPLSDLQSKLSNYLDFEVKGK